MADVASSRPAAHYAPSRPQGGGFRKADRTDTKVSLQVKERARVPAPATNRHPRGVAGQGFFPVALSLEVAAGSCRERPRGAPPATAADPLSHLRHKPGKSE